ncbi:hypothetical protein FACS1894133_1720 [Clostridia bacterium]|nr:hypothetical protein FACS1894133_1720 [Clostridia bacterium]
MLKSKKLDDQKFEDIMEYAIGRLPWICPDWTDYNAYDPGITILELMAWYKEMQQYRLDIVTDTMQKKLLKLVGITPKPACPAHCRVAISPGGAYDPPFCRLTTAEGILFELVSPVSGDAKLGEVFVKSDSGEMTDVSDVLNHISISPFKNEGDSSRLIIHFEDVGKNDEKLRLWFEIEDNYPVKRNPFSDDNQVLRKIEWHFSDAGVIEPLKDETHALCQSGYVTFVTPDEWQQPGDSFERTLSVSLSDDSGLENTKIRGILLRSFEAVQQETWSYVESKNTAFDDDSYIIHFDPEYKQDLIFSSTGMPNMKLRLDLGERKVLTDRLVLECDTLCADGAIRKRIWLYTDNITKCSARDRVFTLDKEGTSIVFGDGQHGAIVPSGKNTITLASFVLSFCEKGNIPKGTLKFVHNGEEVNNTQAEGGRAEETVTEAVARLDRQLNRSSKCASKEDYERAALRTPGLMVAAARAIPYYDPFEPTGRTNISVITVVAVPYSEAKNPIPDDVFMLAISKHLESLRPICTRIIIIPPIYIPISISVQIRADDAVNINDALRDVIRGYLAISRERQIGDPIVRNELISVILGLEYVYKTERLDFYITDGQSHLSRGLDVILPKNGIAYLDDLDVTVSNYK